MNVQDSRTGEVISKCFNAEIEPKTMKVNLSWFGNIIPDAEMIVLYPFLLSG